jgi:hypothetical protein
MYMRADPAIVIDRTARVHDRIAADSRTGLYDGSSHHLNAVTESHIFRNARARVDDAAKRKPQPSTVLIDALPGKGVYYTAHPIDEFILLGGKPLQIGVISQHRHLEDRCRQIVAVAGHNPMHGYTIQMQYIAQHAAVAARAQ